ncbi:MAG: site-specific integrase [Hyphomicrobiales bacterium]|nr:site-specific integrase [Hyphomicrobiales bacterium]
MASSRGNWGAVRKLPSGRYQIRYRVQGERRSGQTTYTTKRDAHAALAALRTDLERGDWIDPEAAKSITLRQYATRWLDLRPNLAARTIELYESELRLHIFPKLGEVTLADLSPDRIRTWHAGLVKKAPGRTTPAKSYRLLRTILGTAVDDNLLHRNPCNIKGAGVERPAERPTASIDQVYELAEVIEPRLRLMVLLATFTSLRLGELRGLTRRRIDLDSHEIAVVEQIQDLGDGTVSVTPPKSAAGQRTVAFPPTLIDEIRQHLHAYAADGPDGLLFRTRDGDPIRKANLYRAWSKARRSVGVDHLHFHDLRHTGNTLAATTGASTRELMARMGHTSPRAALIYQHASRERDHAIAQALDDVVKPGRTGAS